MSAKVIYRTWRWKRPSGARIVGGSWLRPIIDVTWCSERDGGLVRTYRNGRPVK